MVSYPAVIMFVLKGALKGAKGDSVWEDSMQRTLPVVAKHGPTIGHSHSQHAF